MYTLNLHNYISMLSHKSGGKMKKKLQLSEPTMCFTVLPALLLFFLFFFSYVALGNKTSALGLIEMNC